VIVIATDILQSLKITLKLIVIIATVKILMLVRHVNIVANVVLHTLHLTAKSVVTTLRNRTNNHDVIESDQCVDFITKMSFSKIWRD
jgi:hypothetical protein